VGHTLDLYYSAFRIPDLLFALVASLVSAYVLIPRIAGAKREETLTLLSQAVSFLLLVGGGLSIVVAIFLPHTLFLLYPAFAESPLQDAFVTLTRILLLQPILLGISGIITSVTQVHRRFILFALSPVLYNLGIIVGALLLYPWYGLPGIGVGVVIGAVLHACIHIPVLREAGVWPRLVWPRFSYMQDIVRDSIPRSLALGMGSLTALFLTILAARAGTGSVSVFSFALNLEAVPLSLIGASYAVAAFPALSEQSSLRNKEEFTRILSVSAKHIIVWSLLALAFIIVLRAHLVRSILGAGAFDWEATRLTAALLAILSVGLVAQGLVLLFSRALYAAKQSWAPFMYQFAGGVVTILLALALLTWEGVGTPFLDFFAHLLRVGDLADRASILLIALAAAIGQIVLAVCSLFALRRDAPGLSRRLIRPSLQGGFAALSGAVVAYGVLSVLGEIAPLTTFAAVFTEACIAGIVGLIASALVLHMVSNEEFKEMIGALRRFVGVRQVLSPSAGEST
jgi:putative peptidoglycan lipid II flippase